MSGHVVGVIPENPGRSRRLGRHIHFDDRSLPHRVQLEHTRELAIVSKTWERKLGPLDQGSLGACTGNGCVGVLATAPNSRDGVADNVRFGQALAKKIYTHASKIDSIRGEWPPKDTGSTVLAAMKAAKELGLISGYKWCLGTEDVLRTLSHVGPVEVGLNWYAGFDNPDKLGRVKLTGKCEGGHAFELIGIDQQNQRVIAVNSWGSGWGVRGRFSFSYEDLRRLMKEDGEAVMVLPPT